MRKLVIGEHRSERRRASWRAYYRRNAPRIRQSARTWYWGHHDYALAKKAAYRRKQWRAPVWGSRPMTTQGWADVKHHYQATRAMGDSLTFKQLGAWFRISPRRIQARSSRDKGWSLRFTPDRKLLAGPAR